MQDGICAFAVGSPEGLRSASYRIRIDAAGPAVHVAGRAGGSPFEAAVLVPPAGGSGSERGSAPLTRESLRSAVARGAWALGGELVADWPGEAVAPGVREQFSVCIPASALRPFAEPADGLRPTWLPSPPEFGQLAVSVFIVERAGQWQPLAQAVLGRGALPDGREVLAAWSVEGAGSPLQKAGLFGALRKRRPPDLPQTILVLPDARLVLAWQLGGRGMFTEVAGDMFTTPGSC